MTLDEEAIRAGYPNFATYQHMQRLKSRREAQQESATRQAKLMALRREQQTAAGAGTILSPLCHDNNSHVAQSALRERALNRLP